MGEGAGQLLDPSCCPGLSPARVVWHLSTVGLQLELQGRGRSPTPIVGVTPAGGR